MRDIVSALTSTLRFRTFVTILVATHLLDDLRAGGSFDVIAPVDDAFHRLPRDVLEALFSESNIEALIDFAELHVWPRGARLVYPRTHRARPIEVWPCSNGALHVVDSLVLPAHLEARAAGRKGLN